MLLLTQKKQNNANALFFRKLRQSSPHSPVQASMLTTPPSDYNALLLRLYRLSHEQPLEQFQEAALAVIKPVLPFDSAMWGSATLTDIGIDVHTIHLHNQPLEMLQAYEEVKHLDTAALEATKHPEATLGFDAGSWFSSKDKAALRAYGERFDLAHFFIGSTLHTKTRFTRWLTLFRSNARSHCTESERILLGSLMPHIHQALELNRITHLNQLGMANATSHSGTAIADPRGMLYHMDALFEHAVRAEWTDWRGPALPGALIAHFLQGQCRFVGRTLVMVLRAEHGLLFLRTRPRYPADDLTPREFTVGQWMSKGNTHKEIASILQRSPATVRNQIRSVYYKLSVSNVVGLIEALRLVE